MRSAAALALLALVGCDRGSPPKKVTTMEIGSAVSAAPAAAPTPEQRYKAVGTEPFWAVFVENGRLRYTMPENISGTSFPAKRSVEGEAVVWTGTFERGAFTLRIAPGACSDGMSDTVFAYKAMVAFADKTLQGCAQRQ